MLFSVNERTIGVTNCPDNFKCLKQANSGMCQVERRLLGDGVFVNGDGREHCDYLTIYGFSFICNCPTRIELYDRYRI